MGICVVIVEKFEVSIDNLEGKFELRDYSFEDEFYTGKETEMFGLFNERLVDDSPKQLFLNHQKVISV